MDIRLVPNPSENNLNKTKPFSNGNGKSIDGAAAEKKQQEALTEQNNDKSGFGAEGFHHSILSESEAGIDFGLWANVSIAILIITVLVFGGLWAYKFYLIREKDRLSEEIENINSQRDLVLEESFIDLKNTVDVFEDISKNKVLTSDFFGFLEELTLPQVRLSELNADFSQREIGFKIEAADYNALAKQLYLFQEDERVEDASLTSASLDAFGRAVSDLTIILSPNFFK